MNFFDELRIRKAIAERDKDVRLSLIQDLQKKLESMKKDKHNNLAGNPGEWDLSVISWNAALSEINNYLNTLK